MPKPCVLDGPFKLVSVLPFHNAAVSTPLDMVSPAIWPELLMALAGAT